MIDPPSHYVNFIVIAMRLPLFNPLSPAPPEADLRSWGEMWMILS
jgi:hypothetical protein